ncbi:peptidase family M49-domain-containing protein [Phakopsora pachyrhizi]|uniref:Dipeptidyl peptidase 3 n=1 Tax=Phakopsora pachyrhizi TaxID=170000 RepID=A0AAV0AU58_PHAPC|nr:peptidase family M49-domain-containing protein [Phakopsora pachyrhizi]CAH7671578.1 peptidase family M49-domain-containing protein [Phakopsora pachyrhizi]
MSSSLNRSRYEPDREPPICSLNITESFEGLTNDERLYAHWMSRASWHGARLIMNQWTPRAEQLYNFITCVFGSTDDPTRLSSFQSLKSQSSLRDQEWNDLLDYCSQVLSNLCNYKSFGATKFIPRCSEQNFLALINASERRAEAQELWQQVKDEVYSLEPTGLLDIGKPSAGHLSNYYPDSPSITDQEINSVQAVCDENHLSTLNTRLVKKSSTEFTLLISSVDDELPPNFPASPLKSTSQQPPLTIHLKPSDFSEPLAKVCQSLAEAKKYSKSSIRESMIEDYIRCFRTGDMEAHKSASKHWVKDISPTVESYLGHIEAYVDPFAMRAEWEGFTAIVNKELSKKFEALVDRADQLVKSLPWGKSFEVDVFRRPDFTALEILNFATGGIPAGINIPNYFDVRESVGFKNVSLVNILSAKAPNEEISFIRPEEREMYSEWDSKAFDLQVANHELLGHGSGKLLKENSDGSFNFDPKTTINPLTEKPVESWYKPGETYGSKFGLIASSMEECRAETVALYLCSNLEILKIFGYEKDDEIETIQYMTFLLMARAGVRALEWYDPVTHKHGQAHMQARMGITNWMIKNGLIEIEEVRNKDDNSLEDVYVRADRSEILKNGKEVMGRLLIELQIRKSIADGKGATEFYNELTTPINVFWETELRELVIRKKQPRKIFVQPNTKVILNKDGLGGEDVELVDYECTNEGVIRSFVERNI